MRVVVYGAGAVGGVVGALLHRGGDDVTLIARGAHLDAIRADGLTLLWPGGRAREPIPAVGHPGDVDWHDGDVVLVAVKSDATLDAARALAAHAPASVRVVSLQNAVANEPLLLRYVERVYGVCVMAPTGHLEPGVVEAHCHPTAAILDIGRYPDGVDVTCDEVAAAFARAGIVSQPRSDIMRWKYRKLLMNLGNAVQALCERGEAFGELVAVIRAEGEAALRAAGIVPVTAEEDSSRRGDILQSVPIEGRPRTGGSTWQSLARRTGAIETDYLNGEIVWLGRRYDVPTPANELIRRHANAAAARQQSPGGLDPRDLLAALSG